MYTFAIVRYVVNVYLISVQFNIRWFLQFIHVVYVSVYQRIFKYFPLNIGIRIQFVAILKAEYYLNYSNII